MPFGLEPAIALHEIIVAESRCPAYICAGRAVGAVFSEYGDLTVAHEGVTVRQDCQRSLRAGGDGIGGVGEIFEDGCGGIGGIGRRKG